MAVPIYGGLVMAKEHSSGSCSVRVGVSRGRGGSSVRGGRVRWRPSLQYGFVFDGRDDSGMRPLVPTLSPRLRTRRWTPGGTRRGGRPQLHLALGAGLCTRAQQTLPPASETDEQKLPHGR